MLQLAAWWPKFSCLYTEILSNLGGSLISFQVKWTGPTTSWTCFLCVLPMITCWPSELTCNWTATIWHRKSISCLLATTLELVTNEKVVCEQKNLGIWSKFKGLGNFGVTAIKWKFSILSSPLILIYCFFLFLITIEITNEMVWREINWGSAIVK